MTKIVTVHVRNEDGTLIADVVADCDGNLLSCPPEWELIIRERVLLDEPIQWWHPGNWMPTLTGDPGEVSTTIAVALAEFFGPGTYDIDSEQFPVDTTPPAAVN